MDTILRATSFKIINKKILIPFDTSLSKIKDLIKNKYSVVKYHGNSVISKKTTKDQRCQFYLNNNIIRKV